HVRPKVSYWAVGLCEAGAIFAYNFPHPPLTDRILSTLFDSSHSASALQTNPTLLLGTLLTTAGAYIRSRCYRALGQLFTFELSVRKEHHLVTSGPYSIVRHPAYTGSFLAFAGIHTCLFGPGSLLRASGILDTDVGKVIIGAAAVHGAIIAYFFISRTLAEDKVMKEKFGVEWDLWARRVPYRLIPGVF
ncbi:hypothetical protein OE88DRAFT_1751130, partial [Heliocybe sulcata]